MTAIRLSFVLLFCFCISNCVSESDQRLETQSVFYGLALIASRKNNWSSQCYRELRHVVKGVDNNTRWAIKLLDASGVPQSGLYWGGTFWLGSQSQCSVYTSTKRIEIEPIRAVHYRDTTPPFPIAYYAANFRHDSKMQKMVFWEGEDLVTLGLCLPSSCKETEVSDLLQEYFDSRILLHQRVYNMTLRMEAVKKTSDDTSWIWSTKHSIFIITTALLFGMIFIGSIYSTYMNEESSEKQKKYMERENETHKVNNNENGNVLTHNGYYYAEKKMNGVFQVDAIKSDFDTTREILLGFSMGKNARKVFDIKHDDEMLLPLNGIRTILMGFIVYGHITIYGMDKYEGRHKIHYTDDDLASQAFQNGPFVVDTFYCMSGFLLGYTFFKNPKNQNNCTPLHETIKEFLNGVYKRIKRLTPVYVYMLIVSHTAGEWVYRSSALWNRERLDQFCSKYWWTNVLYVNNIVPGVSITCMSWGYYLSNDMQFFIVASFLLYLSKYYFKTSALITLGMCVASGIYTAYIVQVMDYRPYYHTVFETSDTFYSPPWMRIPPYLIGVVSSYLYFHHRDKLPKNKIFPRCGWLLYLVCTGWPLFSLPTRNISIEFSMLYLSTSRVLWSIGSVWLMVSCLTDNAGNLGKILSKDIWIPLARLTYCVYLINPLLVIIFTSMRDKNMYYDEKGVLLSGLGLVFLSFVGAFFLVIFVEYPINNFFDAISKKKTRVEAPKNKIANGHGTNGLSLSSNNSNGIYTNGKVNGSYISCDTKPLKID